MSSNGILELAANEVCEAIRRHAEICEREPENVAAVVLAGEALRKAVLGYEAALSTTSGWSNPIRHLGRLPLFGDRVGPVEAVGDAVSPDQETGTTTTRVVIQARYHLRINNEDALLAFTSGRFGEEISDKSEAIKLLFEAESWDPERYPPGLMNVEDVRVEISVGHAE